MNYIEFYNKKKLLVKGSSNKKTAKNSMRTFYINLQPTNLNSKKENLCRFSTKECRAACLQFAGRQGMPNAVASRNRKTEYFVNQRFNFLVQLWGELSEWNKKGQKIAIRLNLLSDVDWEQEFQNVLGEEYSLEVFNNIQFYKLSLVISN